MKIKAIERINLDVPFTPHSQKHLGYWLPHWRIHQICHITLENSRAPSSVPLLSLQTVSTMK